MESIEYCDVVKETKKMSIDVLSADSSVKIDAHIHPPVSPRIGHSYQADLPNLQRKSEYLRVFTRTIDMHEASGSHINFDIGPPISRYGIPANKEGMKDVSKESPIYMNESANSVMRRCKRNRSNMLMRSHEADNWGSYDKFSNASELAPLTNRYGYTKGPAEMESHKIYLVNDENPLNQRECRSSTSVPVLLSTSWSDAEMKIFILGLYIFGKNFICINKFVTTKNIGDVISLYYGKFFRSDAYRKWSARSKAKGRRHVDGHYILTGWRQQKLLSRLLPNVSKESQNALKEVLMRFDDGGTSLEECVFTIKSIVGTKALVEAVGIGKRKYDLTVVTLDSVRSIQALSTRSKVSTEKTLSSLTIADIIKYLSGDFRLSKARSIDLFWEAVWPRLLAAGWHSEQPKYYAYATTKQALVFLVPGVQKFSRRKLVKGDHYFDSVTDVLNKVASDPMLLGEKSEETAGESRSIADKDGCPKEDNLYQSGISGHENVLYPCQRRQSSISSPVKFTVVDTSFDQDGKLMKIKELRSIPTDSNCSFTNSSASTEDASNHLREQWDLLPAQLEGQNEIVSASSVCKVLENNMKCTIKNGKQSSGSDNNIHEVKINQTGGDGVDGYHSNLLNKLSVKDIKCFARRDKSCRKKYPSPIPKRHKVSTCKDSDSDYLVCEGQNLIKRVNHEGELVDAGHNALSFNLDSSVCSSTKDHGDCIPGTKNIGTNNTSQMVVSDVKSHYIPLIDLNLPQCALNPNVSERSTTDEAVCRRNLNGIETSQSESEEKPYDALRCTGTLNEAAPVEQQAVVIPRRQSTRNRPLTTKALEALAAESFLISQKRKLSKPARHSTARSSRCAQKGNKPSSWVDSTNYGGSALGEECSKFTNDTRLFSGAV